MRRAVIKYNDIKAGILSELEDGTYEFVYNDDYIQTYPNNFVTFDLPVSKTVYRSKRLFAFFDGLIPEGWLLNIASESWKINQNDRMGLLLMCCENCIGAVSVHRINNDTNE